MPQRRCRAGFAQEAFPRRARASCIRGHVDHFERDLAMQHLVVRTISHSHCAMTQLPERSILAPLDLEIAED